MTSGLAHEIKNPLSTVGLNAQLLHEGLEEADLPEDQRSRLLRRLESLKREVERLGGILTDFLQGDRYFKIHRERHNLERARAQLRLVEVLEGREGELQGLVDSL